MDQVVSCDAVTFAQRVGRLQNAPDRLVKMEISLCIV